MNGLGSVSPGDRKKLTTFRDDGLKVLQAIEDQKSGLKDVTKALAEEFGIKPATLTLALRTVFKSSLAEQKEKMDIIEEIIHIVGDD